MVTRMRPWAIKKIPKAKMGVDVALHAGGQKRLGGAADTPEIEHLEHPLAHRDPQRDAQIDACGADLQREAGGRVELVQPGVPQVEGDLLGHQQKQEKPAPRPAGQPAPLRRAKVPAEDDERQADKADHRQRRQVGSGKERERLVGHFREKPRHSPTPFSPFHHTTPPAKGQCGRKGRGRQPGRRKKTAPKRVLLRYRIVKAPCRLQGCRGGKAMKTPGAFGRQGGPQSGAGTSSSRP